MGVENVWCDSPDERDLTVNPWTIGKHLCAVDSVVISGSGSIWWNLPKRRKKSKG